MKTTFDNIERNSERIYLMVDNNDNLIQSVDRAFKILDVFSLKDKELGVTEIANRLGLHKSTAFGLLRTLEHWGCVEQNQSTGKYHLGLKLFEYGNRVKEGLNLRGLSLPFLQDLVERYRETVHLVIHDRGEVIYIEKVEGPSAIRMYSQVGQRAPMHCTGVGKAILAFWSKQEVDNLIRTKGLQPFSPKTITDLQQLHEELSVIRREGYSFDNEEIELGLRCVAAPIMNYNDKVVAAISIAGPSTRMTDEQMQNLIIPVKETALKISQRIGYSLSS